MSKSLHVLIIDDSPAEVVRFESILHANDFVTTAVNTGEEGIEVAARLKPDIILMDVVMGGMNGFQATRKITSQEATQHIPIIMVTTKDQTTDRVWAQRQGAKGYLTKPVDEDLLLSTISELLDLKKDS
ncbi:MAG: response regulator [Pseudomonadota bacterium]|nr:two-component system response regulator [Gammaproteobacteria bacterium]MEC8011793.1 response regulator [Pseudomonadota bacterium]HBF09355.1 two-component system response regulator [Gammaproteobacteria bacterium]|tara:strand:- start:1206 stop:1592 length:387 start_codon:yes stop_codon:yes gene_type:complete